VSRADIVPATVCGTCHRACIAETAKRLLAPITDWQAEGDAVVQEMKKEFDKAWTPHWHIIIGKGFGSMVTHEARRMAFFYIEDKAVLVFKAG
jgi:hypothetical protein